MGQLSTLSPLGDPALPFAGRAWLRQFPHGEYEVVYKSGSNMPSEVERVNAWLEDAGSQNRVTWSSFPRPARVPQPGETPDIPETNKERSVRRARQKIRWLAKCIGADRLLTLTFRENVVDLGEAYKALTPFLAMCRREWPGSFKFVLVPERQKRGAWHFHLAMRGWWNVNKLRGFWWRACGALVSWSDDGRPVLEDRTETPGNVQMNAPRSRGKSRRNWSVDRLSGYLAKYVGKAVAEQDLDGRASYRATRGLHPVIQRYIIRALTYSDVLKQFFTIASPPGVSAYVFESPDRCLLWASGSCAPP